VDIRRWQGKEVQTRVQQLVGGRVEDGRQVQGDWTGLLSMSVTPSLDGVKLVRSS
jgi:hypothetical protein